MSCLKSSFPVYWALANDFAWLSWRGVCLLCFFTRWFMMLSVHESSWLSWLSLTSCGGLDYSGDWCSWRGSGGRSPRVLLWVRRDQELASQSWQEDWICQGVTWSPLSTVSHLDIVIISHSWIYLYYRTSSMTPDEVRNYRYACICVSIIIS